MLMKNIRPLLLLLAMATAWPPLQAQTEETLDAEVGGRLSFNLDKKLARGLHLTFEEEVRFDNNFTAFDRLQSTFAASYKVHPNVKVGLGYAFIAPYSSSSSSFKSTRHRLMLDVTGTLHFNLWNVSLKERLQFTRRAGDFNPYQSPASAWSLKSRLSVKYKGWQHRGFTPYAYLELRHTFSGAAVTATYDTLQDCYYVPGTTSIEGSEAGWFLEGFNSTYLNRLRACIGVDYRMSRAATWTLFLMADRLNDKVIDSNKEGTVLKSYVHRVGAFFSLGVGYTYAF